ncbi:hypothetical protein RUM43_001988 [Polyplax serrata]|uniref:Uncharacterized protein n=1 Tax=Polyplax serrata TaxID=468196 RepID=A0AAN8S945_POLSC
MASKKRKIVGRSEKMVKAGRLQAQSCGQSYVSEKKITQGVIKSNCRQIKSLGERHNLQDDISLSIGRVYTIKLDEELKKASVNE